MHLFRNSSILLLFIVIGLFTTSCSVTKRIYRPGVWFEWGGKNHVAPATTSDSSLCTKSLDKPGNSITDIPALRTIKAEVEQDSTCTSKAASTSTSVLSVAPRTNDTLIIQEKLSDAPDPAVPVNRKAKIALTLTVLALILLAFAAAVYFTMAEVSSAIFFVLLAFYAFCAGWAIARKARREIRKGNYTESGIKMANVAFYTSGIIMLMVLIAMGAGLMYFLSFAWL